MDGNLGLGVGFRVWGQKPPDVPGIALKLLRLAKAGEGYHQ